uniref:Uncharacterized protein n=1 Tax=Anguilla anguilla TaxID=7936 RepID=A0A0E9U4L8_ANGAN
MFLTKVLQYYNTHLAVIMPDKICTSKQLIISKYASLVIYKLLVLQIDSTSNFKGKLT